MTVKNYSHETSWQTWANDIFSNRREHHAFLFMLFDPLHSSLGILQTESVLAGVKHNPYAKTEVPFPTPKKRVTCCICTIFVHIQEPALGTDRPTGSEFEGWIHEQVDGAWCEESRAGGRDSIKSHAEQYFQCSWWSLIVLVHEFARRFITQFVTFISPNFYQKPLCENVRMPHHIPAFTSNPSSSPLSLSQKLKTSYSAEKIVSL